MTQNLGGVTEDELRNHGNFHTPLNHFKFYAPVSVFGLGRRGETYIVDFNDPTLRLNLHIQAQPSCYKNLELLDLDGLAVMILFGVFVCMTVCVLGCECVCVCVSV